MVQLQAAVEEAVDDVLGEEGLELHRSVQLPHGVVVVEQQRDQSSGVVGMELIFNEEYDRLCNEALQTKDPIERYDLLSQAEEILLEETPIIPIYHYVNYFIHKDNVTGLPQNGRKMVKMSRIKTPRSTGPGA